MNLIWELQDIYLDTYYIQYDNGTIKFLITVKHSPCFCPMWYIYLWMFKQITVIAHLFEKGTFIIYATAEMQL